MTIITVSPEAMDVANDIDEMLQQFLVERGMVRKNGQVPGPENGLTRSIAAMVQYAIDRYTERKNNEQKPLSPPAP